MNGLKQTIHRFFRSRGYEIARLDRAGRDPLLDIRRIFLDHRPETIFDVGANEGQTAREFAKVFPHTSIHCFEPFGEVFLKLSDLAKQLANVRAVKIALGDKVEMADLKVNAQSVTNSLLHNSPESDAFQPGGAATAKGSTTVSVSTLDTYCADSDVQFIDILKIDTQGYDLRVLRGGKELISEGRVAVVFVEVLFAPLYSEQAYFEDIYGYLSSRGFRLVNLYNVAHNPDKYASWADALFVHPDVLSQRLAARERAPALSGAAHSTNS